MIKICQFAAAMVVVAFGVQAADPHPAPNVLFILADDVTYNLLGCYGGKDVQTPAIDKLASEGMRFTRAYCATAMCAPFRAELYTGLYPVRSGVAWNHSSARPGTKSICHYLEEQGYRVGLSGKKHASPESVFPFEKVNGLPAGKGVRDFMTRDGNQPFCLFLCSHNAHAPWTSGDSSQFDPDGISLAPVQHDNAATREVMTRYLAEVADLDREVAAALELLDETGQRENTLVIFSSEQGWPLGFAKWSNWDLGVHTALLARWPGKIQPGRVSDTLVQVADIAPTLVEAAGGTVQSGQFDGQSFYVHLFGGGLPARKYVYGLHNNVPEGQPYPIRSIRDGQYHYILNLTPDAAYHEHHVMAKNSRLVWWPALKKAEAAGDPSAVALLEKFHNRPAEELYKVDRDPYEMENLADNPEYVEVKKRLHDELMRWMQEQNDPGVGMDKTEVYKANREAAKKAVSIHK